MTLTEFITGRGTPLASVARQPGHRDRRFALLTALVFCVAVDFCIAIYRLWRTLLASRYSPAPLVILIALTVALPYFWTKTAAERSQLQRRATELNLDAMTVEIALRALYRGLFMAAMVALLLLTAIHELVR